MSKRLWNIIVTSLFLNVAHMVEVVLSGYYKFGFQSFDSYFETTSSAIYFASHIPIYFFITLFFLSHKFKQLFKYCLAGYGWIFVSETHHFVRSIVALSYFPGTITSLFYLVLGLFYFYALSKDWSKISS